MPVVSDDEHRHVEDGILPPGSDTEPTARSTPFPSRSSIGLPAHRRPRDPATTNRSIDCVLPAGHPQATRDLVDLRDMAGERWVMDHPTCPFYRQTLAMCQAAGFQPDVMANTDSVSVATALELLADTATSVGRTSRRQRQPPSAARPVSPIAPGRARNRWCRRHAVGATTRT
jgi:hypothetical protein